MIIIPQPANEYIMVCTMCKGERRNDTWDIVKWETPCKLCGANKWVWKDLEDFKVKYKGIDDFHNKKLESELK